MAQVPMVGKEFDRVIKAISDAENADNNNKILYIRNGELAFETFDNLFDIVTQG